MGYTKLTLKVA
jgi:hypothetical protein